MEADSETTLDALFQCFICFNRVEKPHLCPKCSKMCCLKCITYWLNQRKRSCPCCRSSLRVNELVPCRFMDDVYAELERLNIKKTETEICDLHEIALNYYCTTCHTLLCSDCAMLEHDKSHQFKRLKDVYDEHSVILQENIAKLAERQDDLKSLIVSVDENIAQVQTAKKSSVKELQQIVLGMSRRLSALTDDKLHTLAGHKEDLFNEIQLIQSLCTEFRSSLNDAICPQTQLIRRSREVQQLVEDVLAKRQLDLKADLHVSCDLPSELQPPFEGSDCVIGPDFTALRNDGVYSMCISMNIIILYVSCVI